MSSPKLFADDSVPLVTDASAIININGTERALAIFSALRHPILVTEHAITELENGRSRGHTDADRLQLLLKKRIVLRTSLGDLGEKVYEALISGPVAETLDDGEAATIAAAIERNGIALIDERKACNLCSAKHPSLELVSTCAILLHQRISASIGVAEQAEAIFSALQSARMRVPPDFLKAVANILGPERTAKCLSLPKNLRAGQK
jgi:predicted nucleic acid-binding protein